ncbi:TolC family protein [candidate division KSB1 bacterium]|nr:MAG: TolC family protein [candidate division KSB1 bacterium]
MINLDNETRFNTIAFAKLKIPVFDWNNRRHSVSQAKIEVVSADLDRSKMMDQISLELNNAKVNVNRTQKQIAIAQQNLTIATENLKLNTISYNEGRLPILDVLSAQISWLQAYTNVVSANFQNKVAIAEYNKALGLNLANR